MIRSAMFSKGYAMAQKRLKTNENGLLRRISDVPRLSKWQAPRQK
jgi:hypothetical protein